MNELAINKFNTIDEDQISLSKAKKLSEKQKETLAQFDNAKFGWRHVSLYTFDSYEMIPPVSNNRFHRFLSRDRTD